MSNQEKYDRGHFHGRNQKPFDISEISSFYEEGYHDGLDQMISEKNKIAISRIIQAQKQGRYINDFMKDLEYYRENEF